MKLHSPARKALYTELVFNLAGFAEDMRHVVDKPTICTVDPQVCPLPSGLSFSIRNTIWDLINATWLSPNHTPKAQKHKADNAVSDNYMDYSADEKNNSANYSEQEGSKCLKKTYQHSSSKGRNRSSDTIGMMYMTSNSVGQFAWRSKDMQLCEMTWSVAVKLMISMILWSTASTTASTTASMRTTQALQVMQTLLESVPYNQDT